jgi:hypothetical protein
MILTGEKEVRGDVDRNRVPVPLGALQMSREAVRGPVMLPRHN